MAEAVTHPTAFHWSGRGIDGGLIETELARLRRAAAGEPGGPEGCAIRTSLLNLIVYADDNESARQALQDIVSFPGHHPSRTLAVIASPSTGESTIDASLAAHCHVAPGLEHQVCCEEVTLTVSGPAAGHLHSIVVPLLVPDLPVYLWWNAPLAANVHSFEEMVESADRLIIDSARQPEPATAIKDMLRLSANPACPCGDLNWGRLDPWRQVVRRHLAARPPARSLSEIARVEVSFAGAEGDPPSVQACLLLGWLAGRLGWDARNAANQGPGRASLSVNRRQATLAARASAQPNVEQGWVVSLRIIASAADGESNLVVHRLDDPRHLSITAQGREELVHIESCEVNDMLARELDSPGRDREYESALSSALPIIMAMSPGGPHTR